jgi:hypothetical protein
MMELKVCHRLQALYAGGGEVGQGAWDRGQAGGQ